jgi:hypothetical protein
MLKMYNFLELSENQKRQYIDAETAFLEWRRVRAQAAEVRGSMFWREQAGRCYLIRSSERGTQKSLGLQTPQTQDIFSRFMARKSETQARLASLSSVVSDHQRMNKALRVGRVPNIVVNTLAALDAVGLHDHFLVIGTHALYAYESACGLRFTPQVMATQDIDLLFDTRKRMTFFSQIKRLDTSFIGALRQADKSFRVKADQKHTAINSTGFEIDVVRRMAREVDPHPLRMSSNEDDLWAVQIGSGEKILGAVRFSQMVVSTTGHMSMMNTMPPWTFIAVKQALAQALERETLKRSKDALQAALVKQLVAQHMPQYQR